jgi:AcrR family transcriptional regulator
MHTREKILHQALQMFNEQGIEYVGLREIAATLGIRVGNITYYFPTKDDLVYEISRQLSQANAELIVFKEGITLHAFLEMLEGVFRNQVRFRCLLLSFVHLMKQNERMAAAYKETQRSRKHTIGANLEALAAGGYLKMTAEDRDFLGANLALIARFWICEATIASPGMPAEAGIKRYLELITRLLLPYTTARGKADLKRFLPA